MHTVLYLHIPIPSVYHFVSFKYYTSVLKIRLVFHKPYEWFKIIRVFHKPYEWFKIIRALKKVCNCLKKTLACYNKYEHKMYKEYELIHMNLLHTLKCIIVLKSLLPLRNAFFTEPVRTLYLKSSCLKYSTVVPVGQNFIHFLLGFAEWYVLCIIFTEASVSLQWCK